MAESPSSDPAPARFAEGAKEAWRRAAPDAQETFYRSASGFSCKLFAVNCFKFEDPGSMFDLVKVV